MKLTKWRAEIAEAKKHGHFSNETKRKAGDWPSCAIGEKFNIPSEFTSTKDIVTVYGQNARELGINFYIAVKQDDIDHAQTILKQIEGLKDSK